MSLSNLGQLQNCVGQFTANAATPVVVNAGYLATAAGGNYTADQARAIVANISRRSIILLQCTTVAGGGDVAISPATIVDGTSFTAVSVANNTSVYKFFILNAQP